MEYYLAMRKNEILPFAIMWMELEGIMLSEISQRNTDIICFYSYLELEKLNRRPWGKRRGKNSWATMWMQLEGIMLSEISQRKTKIIGLHSYEDSKRQNR